jgi:beta-lactamase superfamily II metal-dependent hydrolase
MRIQVFHVGDGDCLLLSGPRTNSAGDAVEHHILVDGGRKTQFRENARDTIYAHDRLDVVYVSHIDDDHISGVVVLMEDVVAWRVHDLVKERDPSRREPRFPRPPDIGEVWHNALFELVGDDLEPQIPGALSTMAGILTGSEDAEQRDLATSMDNLATGERSSMELSRRISPAQLDIKTNRPRNKLMKVGNARHRIVGPFTIDEIGPTEQALDDLRKVWKDWLIDNRDAVLKLQAKMIEDEERLGTTSISESAPQLVSSLGDGSITAPNVASLMLLVRDRSSGGRILLTGDGSSEDVLAGLEHHRRLDAQGRLHVDALKVQHHGATANVTTDFVDRITAENYIFCGNGAHHNPEREVVEAMAFARLGADGAAPVGPLDDFKFWFTSRHDSSGLSDSRIEHMTIIEELVEDIKRDHDPANRFTFEFIAAGHFELTI